MRAWLGFTFAALTAFGVSVERFVVRSHARGIATATTPIVAEALAAPHPPSVATVFAEGRVEVRPGYRVTLGAELGGRVTHVMAKEGQRVKKGELLARLDDRDHQVMLREAQGSWSEAWARVVGRRDDLRRIDSLVRTGALPPNESARMREEKRAAQGRLTAASANAARARLLLERARIVAPLDGVIVSRSVEVGETVSPGGALFVIADTNERWIEAEVDEFDMAHVVVGMPADVRADGMPGRTFSGHVEKIPDVVGARKLRPQDPARPTDASVLLVKVAVDAAAPLKLGQRVEVEFRADLAAHGKR